MGGSPSKIDHHIRPRTSRQTETRFASNLPQSLEASLAHWCPELEPQAVILVGTSGRFDQTQRGFRFHHRRVGLAQLLPKSEWIMAKFGVGSSNSGGGPDSAEPHQDIFKVAHVVSTPRQRLVERAPEGVEVKPKLVDASIHSVAQTEASDLFDRREPRSDSSESGSERLYKRRG